MKWKWYLEEREQWGRYGYLLINMWRGNWDNYIGLFYGKLGASIIYYEYGRLEDNPAYTRYADSLLDKVWSNIHKRTPLSLDSGVFGIGWGLEYLIQNKFVDGLGIEICEKVNEEIKTKRLSYLKDNRFNITIYEKITINNK